MDNTINVILAALSVILGFIGFFFVLKIWLTWGQVDINVLKARVFLDPNFLIRNWVYIFITGAFIVVWRLLELSNLLYTNFLAQNITIVFDLMGLVIITLLVILAYYWYKLVDSAIEHNSRKVEPELKK